MSGESADGLGIIWTCDNCGAVTETGLDDEPVGWLVDEPDWDDEYDDGDAPIDLILCDGCRCPALASCVSSAKTRPLLGVELGAQLEVLLVPAVLVLALEAFAS